MGNGMSVVVFPGQFALVASDLSVEEGWVQGGQAAEVEEVRRMTMKNRRGRHAVSAYLELV